MGAIAPIVSAVSATSSRQLVEVTVLFLECVVLVDRSGGRSTLTSPLTGRTYPLRSLWQLDLPTYEPGEATCPKCADGTSLHAPGSTGTGVGAAAAGTSAGAG